MLPADAGGAGPLLLLRLQEEGADVVIALTHMRIPNDRVLAAEVPELDLVLGEPAGGEEAGCVCVWRGAALVQLLCRR